jgi:hypothetical protein
MPAKNGAAKQAANSRDYERRAEFKLNISLKNA